MRTRGRADRHGEANRGSPRLKRTDVGRTVTAVAMFTALPKKEQNQAFLYHAACTLHDMVGKICNFGYS